MKKNTIFVYAVAGTLALGSALLLVSEKGDRKETEKELKRLKKLQDMEHDFFIRHGRRVEEELDEIRDEICSIYEHLEEMENIRECGR